MQYFLETISHSTTGVKTRTPGFPVVGYKITIGSKNGGPNYVVRSEGSCDGTLQVCHTSYVDASRALMDAPYNDRVAFVKEWNGAAYVTKVHATHDSLTATEIKYNVVTADANYQFKIEAWG